MLGGGGDGGLFIGSVLSVLGGGGVFEVIFFEGM